MSTAQHVPIPSRLPVMVLRDCNLFPDCLLPLHIFEPKYREMLAHSLASSRMFCIGTVKFGKEGNSVRELHPYSTVGVIRACVAQEDGCSNLLLQGLRRVKLSRFSRSKSYLTAKVEPVVSIKAGPVGGHFKERILSLIDEAKRLPVSTQVRDFLGEVDDPEVFADLVAYHILANPHIRQPLLGMDQVSERLQHVMQCLEVVVSLGKES